MANKSVPKFEDTEEIVNAPSFDDTEDVTTDAPVDTGILATLIGQGFKGATMGLSDRLVGAAAVPLRALGLNNTAGELKDVTFDGMTLDPETLKEAYFTARDQDRAKSDRQELENPKLSLGANVVGGFALPGLGVANAAAKGTMAAIGTGAGIGAASGAIATVADTKEIEDTNLGDVATNTLIGGTLGGGLAGVGALLGGAGKMVKNSSVSQKMGKAYDKTKKGVDLITKEGQDDLNKALLGTSDTIVDEVVGSAKKFKDEYSAAIKDLKIGVPAKFQDDIEKLANKLADDQVAGGMIDVRSVDATINKLRSEMQLSDDSIIALKDKIMAAAKAKRDMNAAAGYKKAGAATEAIETSTENLSVKKEVQDRIRQAQDELKEARRAYQDTPSDRATLKLEVRDKEDALMAIRREAQDTGFDVTGDKLNTTKALKTGETVDKSSRDILTQVDPLQAEIDALQQSKIGNSRQITDLVEQKQATNNSAFSGLLNQLDILKKSAPTTNLGTMKDVNINSLRSYAEQMGRKDLIAQIDDIIKQNTPGATKLDTKYKDMIAGLKEMGVSTNDMSGDVIKNSDAATYLTQQLKNAAKNETGDAANKLAASQDILKNNKVDQLITQGKDLGESYNLSKEIADSSFKSLPLRGAVAAGSISKNITAPIAKAVTNGINTVASTRPINAMTRAASKLGNSELGQKVQMIMNMAEGESRNRAIFTLMQQPWFRTASKEDEK